VSHELQSSLIAIASLTGVTVVASPLAKTTSIEMATVWQSAQLAIATAAFCGSTMVPGTWRTANVSLKTDDPSLVLIATAEVSPVLAMATAVPAPAGKAIAAATMIEVAARGSSLERNLGVAFLSIFMGWVWLR
jgi:hypothetical protein